MILALHSRLTWFVHRLYDIACGKDIKMFILVSVCYCTQIDTSCINMIRYLLLCMFQTVFSLFIASVIASCFSSLTLLYLGN